VKVTEAHTMHFSRLD